MQSVQQKVPTAKQSSAKCNSYADAYRSVTSVYNKQLYGVLYLFSLFFSILFQSRLSLHSQTILQVVSMKTFLFSLYLFSFSVFLSFLRHLTFTVWEPAYPSYLAEIVANWYSLESWALFGVYAVISLLIIRPYFSWIAGEQYTFEYLLQPPGHYMGARQLNQENIFISLYAIVLAFYYIRQYLNKRGYVVKKNNVRQPFFYDVKTSLATVLSNAVKTAWYSFLVTYVVFVFCNGSIYYYVARFFGIYNKVLDQPIVGFAWVDIRLFLRLIQSGILTASLYNVTNRVYEVTYSYVLPFTDPYVNQFDCLLEGLEEKNKDYIRVAAFSELALLATRRADKRQLLFESTGRELQDSAWFRIMKECFKVIQDFRSKMDIEYNGIPAVKATTTTATPVQVTPQTIRNRLVIESDASIFNQAKTNCIDYDDRTCNLLCEATEYADDCVPNDLPQRIQNEFVTTLKKRISQNDLIRMIKSIETKCGCVGLLESWYLETKARRYQKVFQKYQLLIWASQTLGALVAGSLKEDRLGYVQNDISSVLNQLLACLTEVEHYVSSPPVKYASLLDDGATVGETRAVILALREAIYQITIAFSDYTETFQIDAKYKHKWARFLNFSE